MDQWEMKLPVKMLLGIVYPCLQVVTRVIASSPVTRDAPGQYFADPGRGVLLSSRSGQ